MPRAARWIIVVSLVAAAFALHARLCSWHWKSSPPEWSLGKKARILGVMHNQAADGVSGLWAGFGVDTGTALVFGVVVPFGMLIAVLVLSLFWRHQDRLRGGHCLGCGYKLEGAGPLDRCPECGMAASQARRIPSK